MLILANVVKDNTTALNGVESIRFSCKRAPAMGADEGAPVTFRPETCYFPPPQGYISVCSRRSVYTVHVAPKTNDLTLHLAKVPKDSSYLV